MHDARSVCFCREQHQTGHALSLWNFYPVSRLRILYPFLPMPIQKKYNHLQACLRALSSPFCIAVSGGLDSRFLAWVCRLTGLSFACVQIEGPHIPAPESAYAGKWLDELGAPHVTVTFDPLRLPELAMNPRTRCYTCKKAMFQKIQTVCAEQGMTTVLEGSQASDATEFRPGRQALHELGILSPLALCGITKRDIKELGVLTGLSWPDQPSRSCLLARFAYDLRLDHTLLKKVAFVEGRLLGLGLRRFKFRVLDRDHFLVQVHPDEGPMFAHHRALIEDVLHRQGITAWRLEMTPNLSGLFDIQNDGIS